MTQITVNFSPSLTAQVKKGVTTALQQILEKRVLPSLAPLFEGPKLDLELRSLIRQTFPEFCASAEAATANSQAGEADASLSHNSDLEARFSDDESEDAPIKAAAKSSPLPETMNNGNCKESVRHAIPSRTEALAMLDQLDEDVRPVLQELLEEKDCELRCELMEKLVQRILADEELESDFSTLATILSHVVQEELSQKVLPSSLDEESVEDSIGSPFFVLLRNLCQTPEEDPSRVPLVSLLLDMSTHLPCVGYFLLYYIKVSKVADVSAYKELAKASQDSKDLASFLLRDLRSCQEDDVDLFCFILPDVYRSFESIVLSNPQFLHRTVSCIDAVQLADLVCHVLRGDMKMLKKENVVQLISE